MNGVISVAFFAVRARWTCLHEALASGSRVIRARGLGRSASATKRVLDRLDLDLAARRVPARDRAERLRARRRCCALVAGLSARPRGELEVASAREQIGFLGHEPLVYRELTALENLDLYGRLYRVPERRERIGMLLERFGLWEARNQRAATFSRGMLQRLALCRALLHEPDLLAPRRAVQRARRARAPRCSTASSPSSRPHATFVVATHDPERVERARDLERGWRFA